MSACPEVLFIVNTLYCGVKNEPYFIRPTALIIFLIRVDLTRALRNKVCRPVQTTAVNVLNGQA